MPSCDSPLANFSAMAQLAWVAWIACPYKPPQVQKVRPVRILPLDQRAFGARSLRLLLLSTFEALTLWGYYLWVTMAVTMAMRTTYGEPYIRLAYASQSQSALNQNFETKTSFQASNLEALNLRGLAWLQSNCNAVKPRVEQVLELERQIQLMKSVNGGCIESGCLSKIIYPPMRQRSLRHRG